MARAVATIAAWTELSVPYTNVSVAPSRRLDATITCKCEQVQGMARTWWLLRPATPSPWIAHICTNDLAWVNHRQDCAAAAPCLRMSPSKGVGFHGDGAGDFVVLPQVPSAVSVVFFPGFFPNW